MKTWVSHNPKILKFNLTGWKTQTVTVAGGFLEPLSIYVTDHHYRVLYAPLVCRRWPGPTTWRRWWEYQHCSPCHTTRSASWRGRGQGETPPSSVLLASKHLKVHEIVQLRHVLSKGMKHRQWRREEQDGLLTVGKSCWEKKPWKRVRSKTLPALI